MSKRIVRIVSLMSALSIIFGIATLAKLKHNKHELEKSLTGTIYYTDRDCKAVKFDIANNSKEISAEESRYITDCYYDAKKDDIIYWNTDDNCDVISILSGNKNIHIPIDEILSCVKVDESKHESFKLTALKNGFVYGIKSYYDNNQNEKLRLYQIDISTQETNSFELSGYFDVCDTQDKRLYFSIDSNVYYLDENEIQQCPTKVSNIVAANDDYVVSYDAHDDFYGKLKVFDANTWKEKYSIRIGSAPYDAVLSPDSTKLLYCVPDYSLDIPGESLGVSEVIILDLKSGATLKYTMTNGIKIIKLVDWTK